MDLEAVKRSLESKPNDSDVDSLPSGFYDAFILSGLSIDLIEPRRFLCSLTVPPCLRNDGKYLHCGVIASLVDLVGSAVFYSVGYSISGVSLEINVSYLDAAFVGEEIEFEAKLLQAGKSIGVASVEVRKKKTGKIIAQARHTKYIAMGSKL